MQSPRFRSVALLPLLVFWICLAPAHTKAQAITHQINLPSGMSWCDDTMINGLAATINAFRGQQSLPQLSIDQIGMKDAEERAVQFAQYMAVNSPSSPGFNPHTGYDTTAASLGYNLVTEDLAYITSDPNYIVNSLWQDPLHLAGLTSTQANIMGVSCVYSNGWPYWTFEPGTGTAAPIGGGPTTLGSTQAAFLSILNAARAQIGAPPLQVSPTLQAASQWMSNDLATKNYLSHTDSLGRSTDQRLIAFGYTYEPWGENLAAGYADASDTYNQLYSACDPDASGNCTYAHRQNMLNPSFVAIGIGLMFNANSNYGYYWAFDFGGYLDQGNSIPTITSFTANPTTVNAGASVTLSWNVSGATGISIDNGLGSISNATSVVVKPGQTTTYKLTASNSAGGSSASVTVTVIPVGSGSPPTTPLLASANAKSSTEVDLSWTASKASAGLAGYEVFRNGTLLTKLTGSGVTYADITVKAATTYSYSVAAYDTVGKLSATSNSLTVTTPASPVPPAPPPTPRSAAPSYSSTVHLSCSGDEFFHWLLLPQHRSVWNASASTQRCSNRFQLGRNIPRAQHSFVRLLCCVAGQLHF